MISFLSFLLKDFTICTCNHLIVSVFDRVNNIMFISPNFLVTSYSCCFISLKIECNIILPKYMPNAILPDDIEMKNIDVTSICTKELSTGE